MKRHRARFQWDEVNREKIGARKKEKNNTVRRQVSLPIRMPDFLMEEQKASPLFEIRQALL